MQCQAVGFEPATTRWSVARTVPLTTVPINAPGMGRFELFNLRALDYGLELRFWVVIAIIAPKH